MRSERLTILITPDEKATLTARAEAVGLSASEFVRRAVEAFDGASDEALNSLMLDEMMRSIQDMNETLDRVNTKVERDLVYLRQLRLDAATAKKAA